MSVGRVDLDLGPQPLDVHVNHSLVGADAMPDVPDELLARKGPPGCIARNSRRTNSRGRNEASRMSRPDVNAPYECRERCVQPTRSDPAPANESADSSSRSVASGDRGSAESTGASALQGA